MKQSTKDINQFRNLVNKELNALKYHKEALIALQDKCTHTSVTNGRCNICVRVFKNEDYLSKKAPTSKVEKPVTDFQFFLLTIRLFLKGWNVIKDTSKRNQRECRWDKKENEEWNQVIQMRKDTSILIFYLNKKTEEINLEKEYSGYGDFIKNAIF